MLRIRAHHLLCIPRFYHGGYSKRFAENMRGVCLAIRKNPQANMQVMIGELDDLCEECPHRHADRCVQSGEIGKWIISQDKKVARYLGIGKGSIHIAKDIFNMSRERVNESTIDYVCRGCIFLENCKRVGINNSFKKELNRLPKVTCSNPLC
jgi:hypothetical protein